MPAWLAARQLASQVARGGSQLRGRGAPAPVQLGGVAPGALSGAVEARLSMTVIYITCRIPVIVTTTYYY